MKNLYYIVRIEPRPGLDDKDDKNVSQGVLVSPEESLEFYEMSLMEFGDNADRSEGWNERLKDRAKRLCDAGEASINNDTGCGVSPEYLSDKEYFQRRLEGLQTLEEYRKACE